MIYIFDFDGTLVDSMHQWSAKMLNILDKNGIYYPPDIIKTITPLGDRGTAEYFRKLGVKMSVSEILELMDSYAMKEYQFNIPAKPYVAETLHRLKADGHTLNVLTASPHKMLDVCLKRLNLYEIFDNVWSCDDFEYTKSQPEIYLSAARRLGADVSDCIFADDNYNAVSAAKAAGMTVIAVFGGTRTRDARRFRPIYPRFSRIIIKAEKAQASAADPARTCAFFIFLRSPVFLSHRVSRHRHCLLKCSLPPLLRNPLRLPPLRRHRQI